MCKIREYEERDAEEIIELWVEVCVREHGFEEWEEGMSKLDESEYEKILVAISDEKVIGSLAYKKVSDEVAELKRFYVYPEYRGKGIAKKLYESILNIIKENNYKKIIVETWEQFEKGIGFYYKNNFELDMQEGMTYNFSIDI